MYLLSRRIFFECMKVFFISVTVLMAFVLMGRALQIKDMLMGLDLTFWDTLLVFWYFKPRFFADYDACFGYVGGIFDFSAHGGG